MVLHEGGDAVRGGDGGGEEEEFWRGSGAPDDFLAPVAEEVGGETGGGFG
jgi:hypothetical protein